MAAKAAGLYSASRLAWAVPTASPSSRRRSSTARCLASFRFDDYKTTDRDEPDAPSLEHLVLTGVEPGAGNVEAARVAAEAENRARALQSRPANDLKPDDLAERARAIAGTSEASRSPSSTAARSSSAEWAAWRPSRAAPTPSLT